jgi:DNA-binding transcriptional ArsR family regulator
MRTTDTGSLSDERAAAASKLFKGLADPKRLQLLAALGDSELCVHELMNVVQMEQSAVSHQLRALRACELVTARKEGRHVYYTLADTHVRDLLQAGVEHAAHMRGK